MMYSIMFARFIIFLGTTTVSYAYLNGLRPCVFQRSAYLKRNSPSHFTKSYVEYERRLTLQASQSVLHGASEHMNFLQKLGNTVQAVVREISGMGKEDGNETKLKEYLHQSHDNSVNDEKVVDLAMTNVDESVEEILEAENFGEVIVNVSKLVVCRKSVLGEYTGGMRDGAWHGQGRLAGDLALGHVLEGHFYGGDLVHGEGAVALRTGTVLEGTWAEGIMHGPGKITSPIGFVQEGVFERGVLLASGSISYSSVTSSAADKSIVVDHPSTNTVNPNLIDKTRTALKGTS